MGFLTKWKYGKRQHQIIIITLPHDFYPIERIDAFKASVHKATGAEVRVITGASGITCI
jgi:hypothetical protein